MNNFVKEIVNWLKEMNAKIGGLKKRIAALESAMREIKSIAVREYSQSRAFTEIIEIAARFTDE